MHPLDGPEEVEVLLIVPDGWATPADFVVNRNANTDALVGLSVWLVGQVWAEPCQSEGTLFDPGPSVDDLAFALQDIPLRHAFRPKEVGVSGFSGQYVEWSVPDDADFDECNIVDGRGSFDSWITGKGGERYQQGPGQTDRLRIVDVEGHWIVIDATAMPEASKGDLAELESIVDTMDIRIR